jgi:hypothetical protein
MASLLKGTILALYDSWHDTMRQIHEISAPTALKMYREELDDLWKQAEHLNQLEGIHPQDRTYLKMILQRSPDQWWLFAKSRGKPISGDDRYTPSKK